MEFVDILQELSKRVRSKFYRFIVYAEGRVEVDFESRNLSPECLVVRFEDGREVPEILERSPDVEILVEDTIIRKKCTKCFLHERKVLPSEI